MSEERSRGNAHSGAPPSGSPAPQGLRRPSRETLAKIRELSERRLSPEEFQALADAPFSPEEEAGNLELIRWFLRRYPKPEDRLAYVRRAYARWKAWIED